MRNRFRRGFTLIEVLIAAILLFGALTALGISWRGSTLSFSKAKKLDVITNLLQQKITEMELKYQKEFPTDKAEESGTFEGYKDMAWKVEVQPLEFPDLTPMIVAEEEDGASQLLITVVRQMTEYFSQAIFEMRVTVIWKARGRDLNYSITTYLVNYENELSLGAGGP